MATRFAQLHELCAELSGADPEKLRAFMAQGMLCNVAAALDMPQIAWDENWARERAGRARERLRARRALAAERQLASSIARPLGEARAWPVAIVER